MAQMQIRRKKRRTWVIEALLVIFVAVGIYYLVRERKLNAHQTRRARPTELTAPGIPILPPDLGGPITPPPATQRDLVAAQNALREKVGVPPLTWSDDLAKVAQQYAENLMIRGTFVHSNDRRYGENLYMISGPGASASPFEVITAWGSESAFYQYRSNSCSDVCGHYTQIVWKETKAVGCGSAQNADREIWVCNYAPFGNIVGEKPY